MQCCLEHLGQHCMGFWTVQCCLKSIRAKLHRIFYMQCCLEPLGQHCIGYLPVQRCPKSIKARLHRIFFNAKLSGASRTTLHRVFTCVMLCQEYQDNIKQDFCYTMLSGATQMTFHRILTCAMLCQEY